MKNQQMNKFEYCISIWLLSLIILFGSIYVFRESIYINQLGLFVSIEAISVVMLLISYINPVFCVWTSHRRTWCDVIVSAFIPFAIYALLYDMQYAFWFSIIILIFTVLVCFVITWQIKRKFRKVRAKKIANALRFVVCAIMIIPITASFMFNLFGDRTVQSQVAVNSDMPMKDDSMVKAQIEILTPLIDGSWAELDTQSKLDILQTVVNIESTYLGCKALPLVSDVIGPTTLGHYDQGENRITIDTECLTTVEPKEAVMIVIHEVRHVYQKQVVDTINWERDGSLTLDGFWKYRKWKENYDNYIPASNLEEYSKQAIEVDARMYALEQVPVYFDKISEHSGIAQ